MRPSIFLLGALLLATAGPVGEEAQSASKPVAALLKPNQLVQTVSSPKLDYDQAVLEPLHREQEEKAKAEEDARAVQEAAHKSWLESIANRVKPLGTYSNNYALGNCTEYVASRISVSNSMGNATNWSYELSNAGWSYGDPVAGAIGVSHAGQMGHVVIAEQISTYGVLISEMNYAGFNIVDERWVGKTEFTWFY